MNGSKRLGAWAGLFVSLLFIAPVTGTAFQWPDTGQEKFYDDGGELLGCPEPGHPWYGQDAQYQGQRSYTKLDASGNALSDSAASWTMVLDNVTGLIWEVKTDDGSIHDKDNKYTWCDPNPDTNGGSQGTCGNGTDTLDFIAALNAAGFGGRTDWRLPTIKELSTLVHSGKGAAPFIDLTYFPRTISWAYWSSSPCIYDADGTWCVGFNGGRVDCGNKSLGFYVRAVSSGK